MIFPNLKWPPVLLLLFGFACNAPEQTPEPNPVSFDRQLLQTALAAHGGDAYETAHCAFGFRDKSYRFHNEGAAYTYAVTYNKDWEVIEDVLTNEGFERKENMIITELDDKSEQQGIEALNSVIYFATLPHKLTDAAVRTAHLGETTVKGKEYQLLGVTFVREGGGTDFDDEFLYWISSEDGTIDYLAYNYRVNGGGVRFREAYNERRVAGILFQDYVNYEAAVGTPLVELAERFEMGGLKKLSLIELEDIRNLKNGNR